MNHPRAARSGLLPLCALLLCSRAHGAAFASMFTGASVVLQANADARVWGTATPNSRVSLTVDGAPAVAVTADAGGRWEAALPPHAPSWHTAITASEAGDAVPALATVGYGQVILGGGQSNMELTLSQLAGGAAVAASIGAYTGRISLATIAAPRATVPRWNGTASAPMWNALSPGPNGTASSYSGLCFLVGKAVYDALGGTMPVGLIAGSVGGTAIESWLPEGVLGSVCPADTPPCDPHMPDASLYARFIQPFAPYTLGALLWDQGERDVHCFAPVANKTANYACMQRALVDTWRTAFKSEGAAFAAVQLPGYLGDCDKVEGGHRTDSSYYNCVPGVFNMRLAQDAGVTGIANASLIPTYDLSCPFGVVTPQCPLGSVHNINKTLVASRAAHALLTTLAPSHFPAAAAAPPRAVSASEGPTGRSYFQVTVTIKGGGVPVALSPTQYCVACCDGSVGDFDVSVDGVNWVNATVPETSGVDSVTVVAQLPAHPIRVRYTGNQGFPQCAVVAANGLPLMPFDIAIGA